MIAMIEVSSEFITKQEDFRDASRLSLYDFALERSLVNVTPIMCFSDRHSGERPDGNARAGCGTS